uniref:Rhodopsin domain-containing protein n=1 Tax=Bionectria ochroleuca TaxID=29856 RepID=A0A0B7KC78_BIOOC
MENLPAGIPPEGVIPNFIDPPTQALIPKAFIYATFPLVLPFVAMRFYARIKYARVGIDDYLCALAVVSQVAQLALTFKVIEQAAGPHMWDIPLVKITSSYAQNSTVLTHMYFVSAMLIKSSILFLYSRIFHPSPMAGFFIHGGMVVNVAFYVSIIIAFIVTCVPRAADYATGGWLSLEFSNRCYQYNSRIGGTSGVMSAILDSYILVLPLGFLWGLKTTTKRKLGLSAVFIAGSSACIFSIASAYFRLTINSTSPQDQDLSWKAMPIYGTSVAEINMGIICSCMPVIIILFKGFNSWSTQFLSRIRSSISNSRKFSDRSKDSDIEMLRYEGIEENGLPEVPRGTMTGMRTFMSNFNRTRPAKMQTELLTVASADLNYHAQLRQEVERKGG